MSTNIMKTIVGEMFTMQGTKILSLSVFEILTNTSRVHSKNITFAIDSESQRCKGDMSEINYMAKYPNL